MIPGLVWTVLEPAKNVFAGETTHVYARVQNLSGQRLQNVYLYATNDMALDLEFKTGKDSGVWREDLFLGDMDNGEVATFYVRAKSYTSDVEGMRTFVIKARERWRLCPTCGK